MVWLNPFALFGLTAIAAPILIHLLVQRRAERFPFPTLRFLQPTRMAAIRRHLLEDLPLLAIRVALVAAAVAALAGPLVLTSARRQAWNRRFVRAVVGDTESAGLVGAGLAPALRQKTFATASLADGIRRAVLWLDTAPPARREIVIASTFPIGSITDGDVGAVPAGIGLRFERAGALPSTRTVEIGQVLTPEGVQRREATLTGDRTSAHDVAAGNSMAWPIDVVSPETEKPAIDAAIAAVLSQHVWAATPDRRAKVVLVQGAVPLANDAAPITQPWMAHAVARIARDADLQAAAARISGGLADARLAAAPWHPLAFAADGRPLAAGAGSANGIVVASAAPAFDVATPLLLRSIADALADVRTLGGAEVVTIADAVLQRWSRSAAPVTAPGIETIEQDDRRWLWLLVLCLLALETWVRRARSAEVSQERDRETARVA
jgi:hypothetical protein